MIAEDQATESVWSAGELATFVTPLALPETNTINVPVLQAVGSNDVLFYCGLTACADTAKLHSAEASYFSASPSYTSYVLPGSGHDLNLAINHTQFFSEASQWVSAHVGG